jgi:hypothetical protein
MRGSGRLFFLGVIWASACADHTLDLLPNEKAAPPTATGGSDTAGNPGAGRGGTAGKPAAGHGGTGGRGGTGGTLPQSGKGGGGSGGTGLVSEGGGSGEPACAFPGCCTPGLPVCYECPHGSADCPYDEVCSLTHGCVQCRPPMDCADPLGCDLDCSPEERCDIKTYTCQKDCIRGQQCPTDRPTCDSQRKVCVECDAAQTPSGCPYPLTCSPIDTCVECLTSASCTATDSKPVCGESWTCRGCRNDNECNSPNTPPNFYRTCDRGTGACVPVEQP